jgi:hypothetical protein
MRKLALIFPFLQVLMTNPSVIFKAIFHAINIHKSRKRVFTYPEFNTGLPEVDLLELFPDFKETVNPYTHLYGTSLPIDLAVLIKLAKQFKDCEYLEIGSWRGESLANVAPFCKRCVSVSLSDEEMRQMGMNERMINMQRFFSKTISNVHHIGANSRKYDFSKLGKFDLIFVDGDHSANGVRIDTEKVFQLLRDENSVIVWHDYVSNYEHINWEVFDGILSGTPADKRNNIFHITNTLCAVYINKQVKVSVPNYPKTPDKEFIISIQIKK